VVNKGRKECEKMKVEEQRLHTMKIIGQMVTRERLEYVWSDEGSYVEDGRVYIEKKPFDIEHSLYRLAAQKAINLQLCSQLLFTKPDELPENLLHRSITFILEGKRTSKKLQDDYPGFRDYFKFLQLVTASTVHTAAQDLVETILIAIYIYLNQRDDGPLREYIDERNVDVITGLMDISLDADDTEEVGRYASDIITLIRSTIPDWGVDREQTTKQSITALAGKVDISTEMMMVDWLKEGLRVELSNELERENSHYTLTNEKTLTDTHHLEDIIDWGDSRPKRYIVSTADGVEDVFWECLERVGRRINYLRQAIQSIIYETEKLRVERYQRRGRLDDKRMHKVVRGEKRVFVQEIDPEPDDICFSLLMDRSGSMGIRGSRKAEHCRDAAVILSETLHSLSIPFEVAMYTSDLPENYTVQHIFVKRFEEDYSGVRFRLGDTPGLGNNDDGASIRLAMSRLDLRPETLKYFVIISDGHPCGSGRPREFMLRTMQLFRNRPIIAIGDRHANLGRWYRWYVRTDSQHIAKNISRLLVRSFEGRNWCSYEHERR